MHGSSCSTCCVPAPCTLSLSAALLCCSLLAGRTQRLPGCYDCRPPCAASCLAVMEGAARVAAAIAPTAATAAAAMVGGRSNPRAASEAFGSLGAAPRHARDRAGCCSTSFDRGSSSGSGGGGWGRRAETAGGWRGFGSWAAGGGGRGAGDRWRWGAGGGRDWEGWSSVALGSALGAAAVALGGLVGVPGPAGLMFADGRQTEGGTGAGGWGGGGDTRGDGRSGGFSSSVGAAAGGHGGAAGTPGIQERLRAAQAELASLWQELREDLDRARAQLPASATGALLPADPPVLSLVPPSSAGLTRPWLGAHGKEEAMQATLAVPQGCDADAVVSALVSELGGGGAGANVHRQISSRTDARGTRTFTMEVVSAAGVGTSGGLSVDLTAPAQGTGTLVVRKHHGGFTGEELRALAAVGRAAYGLQQDGQGAGRGLAAGRRGKGGVAGLDGEWGALERGMDEVMGEVERQMMRGFAGGFGWMLRELESALQQLPSAQEGEEGEEEGEEHGTPAFPFGGNSFHRTFSSASTGTTGDFPADAASDPEAVVGRLPPQRAVRRAKGGQEAESKGYDWGSAEAARAVKQLQGMGAQVYPPGNKDQMDWGILAGYEQQKRQIEDCLLFPLLRPEVYNSVAQGTRETFQSNRPRAVLFEGPPGTGKTTSARVISSQAAVPLVYVPLEAVMSKWYGESEGLLSKVFHAAEALGGAIVFFDELDALGGNRERGDVHEASRRVLSVLLREMDGFDARRSVVIGATNRKTDLDAALLSRFDLIVTFGLPDEACRRQILQRYARHLKQDELQRLAEATPGLSGRDLRDVAEHTERRWASRIVRGEAPEGSLPGIEEYLASAAERLASLGAGGAGRQQGYWV